MSSGAEAATRTQAPPPPAARKPSARAAALVLAVAAAAFATFLALRPHAAIADDALLPCLALDPERPEAVDWSVVAADLWTTWLVVEWPLYRPVATFASAAWFAAAGFDESRLALPCGALHAVAVALCGLLLLRLGVRPAAALFASAFAAFHPATVEVQVWHSTLPEPLQLTATLAAAHALLSYRRGGGAWWAVAWTVALYAAIGSKETGLVAFATLAVVDRAGVGGPWRSLLRAHALPAALALAAWLPLRLVALGAHPTGGLQGLPVEPARLAIGLLEKLGLAFAPSLAELPLLGITAFAALAAAAVLAGKRAGGIAAAAALAAAYVAPAAYHDVFASWQGGRLVYSASFAAGACTALLFAPWPKAPWLGRAATVLLVASLAVAAPRAVGRYAELRAAAADGAVVTSSLRAAAEAAAPNVVCPLLVPEALHRVDQFLPITLFTYGHTPGTANRVLPLTFLTSESLLAGHDYGTGLPLRTACDLGAVILAWPPGALEPLVIPTAPLRAAADHDLAVACGEGGTVRFAAPVSPFAFEAIELAAPPEVTALRVRWTFAAGAPADWRTFALEPAAPRRAVVADDFVLLGAGLQNGGVAGCELAFASPSGETRPAAGTEVRFRPLPPLPWTAHPPAGAVLRLDDLARAVRAPIATAGTRLSCGLLGPATGGTFAAEPGAPLAIPHAAASKLRYAQSLCRRITVALWFHEEREAAAGEPRTVVRRTAPLRLVLER